MGKAYFVGGGGCCLRIVRIDVDRERKIKRTSLANKPVG